MNVIFKLAELIYRSGHEWYNVVVSTTGGIPAYHGTNVGDWQHSKEQKDGSVFVWDEVDGLFTFGLVKPCDPMHGNRPYIWSSRAECLGEIIGTQLMDVSVVDKDSRVHCGYGMRRAEVFALLPYEYSIDVRGAVVKR